MIAHESKNLMMILNANCTKIHKLQKISRLRKSTKQNVLHCFHLHCSPIWKLFTFFSFTGTLVFSLLLTSTMGVVLFTTGSEGVSFPCGEAPVSFLGGSNSPGRGL